MLRVLLALTLLLFPATAVVADDPARIAPRPLASALDAMRAGRWEVAHDLAARDGPAASALIEWHALRDGRGTPEEVLAFLETHPDWPGLDRIRRRNEEVFANRGSTDQILDFFDGAPAQTGTGLLAHAAALAERNRMGEAQASLVLAWRSLELTPAEHDAFLSAAGDLLAPHHAARLDAALWRGWRNIDLMLPLVSEEAAELARLRQILDSPALAEDTIAGLNAAQRGDPGIAHALFNRALRSDKDGAIAILLTQSRSEGGLGQPERWASWRRALARDLMRSGRAPQAYALASVHQLMEGANYADLEWLSGYLALSYLRDPERALDHFQRFRAAVASPISLGRAGYWIGRAQEALGDPEAAALAYTEGAEHQTSFYGLLSAERAGLPIDPGLAGVDDFSPSEDSTADQPLMLQAAVLALAADEPGLARQFFVQLGNTQDRETLTRAAGILQAREEAHLQVLLGKAAASRGVVLPGPYYPLHPLMDVPMRVPPELALAIARRESEFNPLVVSGAGAEGLMQLMPGTAQEMARALSLPFDRGRVRSDWVYNTRLGTAYLAQMAQRFAGNITLISVAYNAGPARPPQWIPRFGDPRGMNERDIVDWIEHIPFRETRNYVMRVSESLPIYRARLGREALPIPFSQELAGASIVPATE